MRLRVALEAVDTPPETGASIRLGWAAYSYNMDSVTQVMDSVTQVMCPYHESEGGLGSGGTPPETGASIRLGWAALHPEQG